MSNHLPLIGKLCTSSSTQLMLTEFRITQWTTPDHPLTTNDQRYTGFFLEICTLQFAFAKVIAQKDLFISLGISCRIRPIQL